MSPLEKMARGLMAYHGQNPDVTITWGGESVLEQRKREVRAALQSLLPPDEGTVEAMQDVYGDVVDYGVTDDDARAMFTAAISHILKEDA